jgi:hypothetical protein
LRQALKTGYDKGVFAIALEVIPVERLWVNPDCGLKTRNWPETKAALAHMVEAARHLWHYRKKAGSPFAPVFYPS